MWNIFLILVPLFTMMILALNARVLPDNYNFFLGNSKLIMFDITALSLLKVFINCIKNGMPFGIVIFIFKVFASLIITILLLAFIRKLFDDKASWKTLFCAFIILFIFVINRLINGDHVLSKLSHCIKIWVNLNNRKTI